MASGIEPLADDSAEDADPTLWTAQGADGEVTVRFSPPNDFGVADHWVFLPDGATVYIPLRAVANGDGSEVSLTLFRTAAMDAQKFEEDAAVGHARPATPEVGARGGLS